MYWTSRKERKSYFWYFICKATAFVIKGDYNKDADIPPSERFLSIQKASYTIPQMRSKDDLASLQHRKELEDEKLFYILSN